MGTIRKESIFVPGPFFLMNCCFKIWLAFENIFHLLDTVYLSYEFLNLVNYQTRNLLPPAYAGR